MVFSELNSDRLQVDAQQQGLVYLTLARPASRNAFDNILIQELRHALTVLADSKKARVILLSGQGKHFSAGADLNWMKSTVGFTSEENKADALNLAQLLQQLATFPKPVLAKVQGACFGGAVGLVSCCDVVFATEETKFCLSEVKLGLIPAVISPYVIAAMGQRQALRYMQTAEIIRAEKAVDIGLVHECLSADNIDLAIAETVQQLLQNGPIALQEAKKLVHDVTNKPIDRPLLEQLAEKIASVRVSAEAQEGLAAFLEKRSPRYVREE